MQLVEKLYNPFIRDNDTTAKVMADVIIALLPCFAVSWFAYGFTPIMVVMVAIGSAMLGEFLFNFIFGYDTRSLGDGSAIVTGMLLAFTLGPLIPLPVVAVGGVMAVIFGKLLWGGLGRNRFNPALTGREIIVVLFPAILNSPAIFTNEQLIKYTTPNILGNEILDKIFFTPFGALGEYSSILLIIGGLYLLWRRRISWHIPLFMLAAFTLPLFFFRDMGVTFSAGGLLLGTIYMATDMPTSSSTNAGKIYFGIMIGLVALTCILLGASRGYLSYAILILNGFVVPINWIFRTRVWGHKKDLMKTIGLTTLLTLAIAATTAFVMWIHTADLLLYVVVIYIIYSIVHFILIRREDAKNDSL